MATPDPATLEKLLASPDVQREMFELNPHTGGYERYPVGWPDFRDVFDLCARDGLGIVIDGECVELAGILEGPHGASTED